MKPHRLFILLLFLLYSLLIFPLTNDSISYNLDSIEKTISLKQKIELYNRALDHAKSKSDSNQIANIYNILGITFQYIGSSDIAIAHYTSALQLNKQLNNRNGISNSLNNLGAIYTQTEQYSKALEYFRKALSIKEILLVESPDNIKFNRYIGGSYNNIGHIYTVMGQHDSAFYYFHKSITIQKTINDALGIAESLNNLGLLYAKLKDYDNALKYLKKAYHISDSISDTYAKVNPLYNIASVYIKMDEIELAEKFLNECNNYAEDINSKDIMISIYQLYSELYSRKNNYILAYNYFKKYAELKENIQSNEIKEKIANLQIIHEVSQKEEKIKLLIREKKIEKERVKIKNRLLVCLLLILLLVLFSAITFFTQKKKLITANKDLYKRNLELIAAEELTAVDTSINKVSVSRMKYQKSAITDDKRSEIAEKIYYLFENEKIYIQQNLTLTVLSEKIPASRTYVSQVINEEFNDNFINVINEYRIKHARKMLSDHKNEIYSIEGIAQFSGFTSISSFNTFFKKQTGLTPSTFRKLAQKEN